MATDDGRVLADQAETWAPIPHYPNYEASSSGNIRKNGKLVATGDYGVSYRKVALFTDRGRHDRAVHHLVLEAFDGPCPAHYVCAHLDGNPTNNAPANLRWVTREENEAHKPGRIPVPTQRLIAKQIGTATHPVIAAAFGVSTKAVQRIAPRSVKEKLYDQRNCGSSPYGLRSFAR